VGAGCGLQRHSRQTGDFRELLLQLINHLKRALRVFFISQGMQICKAGDAGHAFIKTRVVFHRAGTQRVHAEIDRIVPGGHAHEVTDDVHFADFGHAFEIVVTTKLSRNVERGFFHVEGRQTIANATGLRAFEDELFVWTDVAGDFSDSCCHKGINHQDTK
jgi:hypothetical protein